MNGITNKWWLVNTILNDQQSAEDIVQLTFVDFWVGRKRLRNGVSPKNYLFTMCRNKCVDTLSLTKRRKEMLSDLWKSSLNDRVLEEEQVREKRIRSIRKAIEELPPKCKGILIMNKYEGLKYKEIAEKLGISEKTVESQMRIAFIKIRESFEKEIRTIFMLIMNGKVGYSTK